MVTRYLTLVASVYYLSPQVAYLSLFLLFYKMEAICLYSYYFIRWRLNERKLDALNNLELKLNALGEQKPTSYLFARIAEHVHKKKMCFSHFDLKLSTIFSNRPPLLTITDWRRPGHESIAARMFSIYRSGSNLQLPSNQQLRHS